MKRFAIGLVVLLASAASAGPKLPTVAKVTPGSLAHAQTATVLYFNRCRGGCTIQEGSTNDVRTRTSTIPNGCPAGGCTITEWEHGDQTWDELMQCLREVYSPYNVTITDVQPAPGIAYNENVVAGHDNEIGVSAGGIAPVTGDCSPYSYAMSFTFANDYGPDPLTLCYVAAQETGHAYGMGDHSYSFISDGRSACSDPMSYRVDCLSNGQRFFRNEAATCGEFSMQPCRCSGMNSHLKLINALGPGQSIIPPPAITITQPAPDSTVTAGAMMIATASGRRGVAKVELWLNGYKWGERKGVAFGANNQPEAAYAIAIPQEVPDSVIDVVMIAKDDIGAQTMAGPVRVTKGKACTAASECLAGMKCEEGKCFWDPPVGEVGDPCTYNQYCLSGMCVGAAGGDMLCSQTCVPNVGDSCPMGFECLQTGATSGACWPASDDSGCCSTGSEGAAQSALLALGLFVVVRRRRKR